MTKNFQAFDEWYDKKGYGTMESIFDLITLPIFPLIWLFTGGRSLSRTKKVSCAKQYLKEMDDWYGNKGYFKDQWGIYRSI